MSDITPRARLTARVFMWAGIACLSSVLGYGLVTDLLPRLLDGPWWATVAIVGVICLMVAVIILGPPDD